MPDSSPVKYVRLPGSGASRKGTQLISFARITCRLWLGDDHLLQVESAGGYTESYKRFYFRDIQAVCIQKTGHWLAGNLVFGFLTGIFLLWMLPIKNEPGVITLGIIAGCFAFFLIVNLARGATCVCYLKTAVHLEELPSLRRYRNAKKVLARLQPFIETAQGSLMPETLATQYDTLLTGANAMSATPGQFVRLADPELQPYHSNMHQVLFIALLAEAAADLLNIFLPGMPVILLNMIIGGVLAIAVIIALIKQHKTDLKPAVRVVTWIAAGYVALGYFTSYLIMMIFASEERLDGTQWGYLKGLAELKPFETSWWLIILLISTAASAILGSLGLLLLRDYRRAKLPPAP